MDVVFYKVHSKRTRPLYPTPFMRRYNTVYNYSSCKTVWLWRALPFWYLLRYSACRYTVCTSDITEGTYAQIYGYTNCLNTTEYICSDLKVTFRCFIGASLSKPCTSEFNLSICYILLSAVCIPYVCLDCNLMQPWAECRQSVTFSL